MSMYHAHPGHLWPSDEQLLLLKAALLDGERAVAAFRAWRDGVALEQDFGYDTLRLLPLVYHNLLRLGVHDPLMGRLKGVYRRAWCENQRLFYKMRPVLAHLREGGVDLLLLKGAPLVLTHYRNPALRPMADFDVAVRLHHLDRARRLLEGLGWRCEGAPSVEDLRNRHALYFEDAEHSEIDLHYHLLRDALHPHADRWFWSASEPLDFLGVETMQLEPTALLFHTILHGVRWNRETPIRWIADATMILRTRGEDIDWDRLLAFAAASNMTYRLALGLNYLARTFDLTLPEWVEARLRRHRPTLLERIEKTVVLGDRERWYRDPLTKQWVIFAEYWRTTDARGPVDFVVGYSHYLRYRWALRGRCEIVSVVWHGVLRRLSARSAGPPPAATPR